LPGHRCRQQECLRSGARWWHRDEAEVRSDTGRVSPDGPGEVATKAGAGPRHLTFHPNGKFAYLITETTATIGTFAVDPASGTLNELQFVDTNQYKEQPTALDIHVSPDGKFLYGAERKMRLHHFQMKIWQNL
jgi:6-phosphogluconolactonase